jgi:hypothetical protein
VKRLLLLAVVALAVASSACAGSGGPKENAAASAARVRAYASAVDLLAKDAGRIVVEEIKPRLTDLREGKVTPEQFRSEAALWRTKFEATRDALNQLRPTPALRRANELFDTAFRQYAEAMTAFSEASRKPDVGAAITQAIPLAERADRTYDRADAIVQKELRRLALPTRPTIP